jgi:branched-subunit amino acid transport protein
MTIWTVVIAAGVATYLLRISMLVVAAHTEIPGLVKRAAVVAVPAAFAALATTAFVGQVTASTSAIPVAVAMAAGVVAVRRSGSARAAVLVGMPTLWVLSALQSA